jgi:hypothetical protein
MPQIGIPLVKPVGAPARDHLCLAGPALGRTAPQRRYYRNRAGRHQCADRSCRRQDAARPGAGLLCENAQVQDAVGRADAILNAGRAYRTAQITELWNTVAAGEETTLEQRARGDGPGVPARRQHVVQAREPPRRMLARPAHRRPDRHARSNGTRSAAAYTSAWTRPAPALASRRQVAERECRRAAGAQVPITFPNARLASNAIFPALPRSCRPGYRQITGY